MAGYIRPKHISLTLFIKLFQECRLHPSHTMVKVLYLFGITRALLTNYKIMQIVVNKVCLQFTENLENIQTITLYSPWNYEIVKPSLSLNLSISER